MYSLRFLNLQYLFLLGSLEPTQMQNKKSTTICFDVYESEEIKKYIGGKRRKFRCAFDQILTKKLKMKIGLKCQLKSKCNWFNKKKNVFWSGTYVCTKASCEASYKCIINEPFRFDKGVIVHMKK